MASVFLSYKSEDRDLIATLAHALAREGFSVWWDKKISAGGSWRETTASALAEAKVVILAWSKRTEDSSAAAGVFNEVDEAQRLKLPIIPVQLEACTIPLGYRHLQAANLAAWRGDANDPDWIEVRDAVRAALDGQRMGGATQARRPVLTGVAVIAAFIVAGFFVWRQEQSAIDQVTPGQFNTEATTAFVASNGASASGAEALPIAATETAPAAGRVRSIAFGNENAAGRFVSEGGGGWVEVDADGRRRFTFREVSADADEVVLFDASRDMTLRIDLTCRQVFWRQSGGPNNYIYEVRSIER